MPLFLCAEAALYGAFLLCDVRGESALSTALKYTALVLCFLFSLRRRSAPDGRLVCAALALTALADLFLLVLDRNYTLGVALFCAVQALYALRLRRLQSGAPPALWPRAALSGGALILAVFGGALNGLTALVCVYFPQLLCNAMESLGLPPGRRAWLFRAGLWLFVGCDVCVGLHNLPSGTLSAAAARWAQLGMWFFYLPSQVLLVLSAEKRFSP